ncbi:hypothetical protein COSO111634_31775 [Corallococcus soli]
MKSVPFSRRHSARRPCISACGNTSRCVAPGLRVSPVRGWSVSSSSAGGAPSNCLRQYASCLSSSAPWSQSRCQTVKSAYWMGSAGSGEGRPEVKAS